MKTKILAAITGLMMLSPAYASHPQCGKTELAETMGEMKDAMKAYKKAFKSGDDKATAEISESLLSMIDKASKNIPLKISDSETLSVVQKNKVEMYKKGMKKLKDAVIQLNKAENKEAKKAALKLIGKASKKGHKAFKMKCDD